MFARRKLDATATAAPPKEEPGSIGKTIGGIAGAVIGTYFGGPAGGTAGYQAGSNAGSGVDQLVAGDSSGWDAVSGINQFSKYANMIKKNKDGQALKPGEEGNIAPSDGETGSLADNMGDISGGE